MQQRERRTMRQWPGIGTVMVGKQRAGRVYGAVGVCGHSLSIDFFSCKIRRKEGLSWWSRGQDFVLPPLQGELVGSLIRGN